MYVLFVFSELKIGMSTSFGDNTGIAFNSPGPKVIKKISCSTQLSMTF